MKKMQKILGLFFLVLIIIAGMGVFGVWQWYMSALKAPQQSEQVVAITIPKGSSTQSIATLLEEEGLIRNKWAFIFYSRRQGLVSKFQAGNYRLKKNLSIPDIAQTLTKNTEGVWVTLIEGWRKEQVALELEKAFAGKSPDFSITEFLDLTENSEGRLFPDTYMFPTMATTQLVVNAIQRTFSERTSEIFVNKKVPLSDEEIIVLASLVEREAAREEDLPIVAGILLKRLEADWPLQVDASLQYIKATEQCRSTSPECENWWPVPLGIDKELDSLFNTYKHIGLPPSAIGNPGVRAISAAAQPQSSEYWFYLTDTYGNMHYAIDYDEHLANIEKYLR